MTGTVAPGVTALKKLMFLIMESPAIHVVGEKRGRGEVFIAGECRVGFHISTSDLRVDLSAGPEQGRPPKCLVTVSFNIFILQRAEEVTPRDDGR